MRSHVALGAFLFPFVGGAVLIALEITTTGLVGEVLLEEDQVVEWATSFAFLAMAVGGGAVAAHLWRHSLEPQALVYALLSVVAFVAAGEEISWGQRLLGLETPEPVARANLQEELTFHNLSFVYPLYVAATLVVGLYGSAGSIFTYHSGRVRPGRNAYLFVPPVFLSGAFAQLALYRLVRYGGVPVTSYTEWCELCVAAALAFFVFLNLARLRRENRRDQPLLETSEATERRVREVA